MPYAGGAGGGVRRRYLGVNKEAVASDYVELGYHGCVLKNGWIPESTVRDWATSIGIGRPLRGLGRPTRLPFLAEATVLNHVLTMRRLGAPVDAQALQLMGSDLMPNREQLSRAWAKYVWWLPESVSSIFLSQVVQT